MGSHAIRQWGTAPDGMRIAVAIAVLLVAGAAGVAIAKLGATGAAGFGWLSLVLLGLRFPALPLALTLTVYVVISSNEADNGLLRGSEQLYHEVAGPLTPVDLLIVAAAIAAVAAIARTPPEDRADAWTPLALPLLVLLGTGAVSGLLVHREGTGAVLALVPLIRLVTVFAIASILFAGGHLRRGHVVVGAVAASQVVGALGLYNSFLGGAPDAGTITETTLAGGTEPADERTLAFIDAGSGLVLAVGLAAILTRLIWGPRAIRPWLGILAVLPFLALILSARRAMWIDLAVASTVIVLVSARVQRGVLVIALVAVSIAGIAFVSLTQSSPAYRERVDAIPTFLSGGSTEGNIRSRQIETSAVWRTITGEPIIGIGLTAPYLSNVQFQYQDATYLHNNYLWVWLKFGLLGLVALLWVIWATARWGLATGGSLVSSGHLDDRQAALVATAAMLGFFVAIATASFLTASIRPPVLAGVLLALVGTTAQRPKTWRPGERSAAQAHV